MTCAFISQTRKEELNQLQLFFEIDPDREFATYEVGCVTMSWYRFRTAYFIKLKIELGEKTEHELVNPLLLRLVRYDPYSELDAVVPESGAICFVADSPGQYGFRLL